MTDQRLENILGALSLCLADELMLGAQTSLPDNLSAPAAAITLIGHCPGLTIRHLSGALRLSHPGTVRLVDRLVADGVVVRKRSEEDRRAAALFLTDRGQDINVAVLDRRGGVLASKLAILSDNERSALSEIVSKLLRSLLESPEHALQICRLCDDEACKDCPVEAEICFRSI